MSDVYSDSETDSISAIEVYFDSEIDSEPGILSPVEFYSMLVLGSEADNNLANSRVVYNNYKITFINRLLAMPQRGFEENFAMLLYYQSIRYLRVDVIRAYMFLYQELIKEFFIKDLTYSLTLSPEEKTEFKKLVREKQVIEELLVNGLQSSKQNYKVCRLAFLFICYRIISDNSLIIYGMIEPDINLLVEYEELRDKIGKFNVAEYLADMFVSLSREKQDIILKLDFVEIIDVLKTILDIAIPLLRDRTDEIEPLVRRYEYHMSSYCKDGYYRELLVAKAEEEGKDKDLNKLRLRAFDAACAIKEANLNVDRTMRYALCAFKSSSRIRQSLDNFFPHNHNVGSFICHRRMLRLI